MSVIANLIGSSLILSLFAKYQILNNQYKIKNPTRLKYSVVLYSNLASLLVIKRINIIILIKPAEIPKDKSIGISKLE